MSSNHLDRFRVLLVGGGAREHAIAEALCRSGRVDLFAVAHNYNPGIDQLAIKFDHSRSERDLSGIVDFARENRIDFAVIGLEDPLVVGLPDALAASQIPTVGPRLKAARVETSKLYLRDLMQKHGISGQIGYKYFSDADALEVFLSHSSRDYALKPDGLTAGKGVRVMGVQLKSRAEAISYGRSVIEGQIGGVAGVILEERVVGEEFTLQAFVDGKTIIPMPLVRDFKRAYDGDKGPNTGSMGSYSLADGLLPFVSQQAFSEALDIVTSVVIALQNEGIIYQGFIYGQFCMTSEGPKLIEINARLGDPEGINALTLLTTDFVDVCRAIFNGTLDHIKIEFKPLATVCRYVTPAGYPDKPQQGSPLTIDRNAIEQLGVSVYYAKVDRGTRENEVLTSTSRAIALVGQAAIVAKAEEAVVQALRYVHGEFHVRTDIGKGVFERTPIGSMR